METKIQKAMSEAVIREAALLYDTPFDSIKKVGGFENFVFEYIKNEQFYILRFVHSAHRSYTQVLAELEFIDYLDNNDATVSTVVHSKNDNLVEKLDLNDEDYFTICVFEKAPGNFVKREDLTDEFYQYFGREVGRLHKLTKSYNPKHKRIDWDEESYIDLGKKFLPQKDAKIIEKYEILMEKIRKFPKNIDNFGLIHTDLHFGNMFISSGKLTFFDWDDASYKHFISDLTIVIFYHFHSADIDDDTLNKRSRRILANFLKGYRLENSIKKSDLDKLNDFLRLRMIILYIVIHAAGEEMLNGRFGKFYIDKYRNKILHDTPYFDLNYVIEGL